MEHSSLKQALSLCVIGPTALCSTAEDVLLTAYLFHHFPPPLYKDFS
jgi:hypothetical protein